MIEAEKNEIVNALKVLKSTCISFQGLNNDYPDMDKCKECPLGYSFGGCQVSQMYPFNYDINDSTKIWRVLK